METPFVLNLFSLCCVWMVGIEGGVVARGGEGFNHLCLGVFLNGRGKDLRGFDGLTYPPKPSFLIPWDFFFCSLEFILLFLDHYLFMCKSFVEII